MVIGALVLALASSDGTSALPAAPLALVAIGWVFYYRAHLALRTVKRDQHWYAGHQQLSVADTSLRTAPSPFPWPWAIPAAAITLATGVAGLIAYPHLPARLPVHYGAGGSVDRWADRSVTSVFAGFATQVVVTVMIVALGRLVSRARAELDADDPIGSADRHRQFVLRMQRAMLVLTAAVDLSLALTSVVAWSGIQSAGTAALAWVLPSLAGLVVIVMVAARTGQSGSRLVRSDGTATHGRVVDDAHSGSPVRRATVVAERDDDRYWHAGVFYVHRNDPSFLVPKRFGIGWTINFGHAANWIVLALSVLVPLVVQILTHR